jgi:hypothetical protein
MSYYHENVYWPAKDGTWNVGFYLDVWRGEDEWDVEWDFNHFCWASGGHRTQDDARAAWTGANPGCAIVWDDRDKMPDGEAENLDAMLAAYKEEERQRRKRFRERGGYLWV